jgi:hypothetical protein
MHSSGSFRNILMHSSGSFRNILMHSSGSSRNILMHSSGQAEETLRNLSKVVNWIFSIGSALNCSAERPNVAT